MKRITLIVAFTLLASCATSSTRYWARKDDLNTEQEFRKHKAHCNAQSNTAVSPTGFTNWKNVDQLFTDCMFGQGWRTSTKAEAMTKYER